MSEATPQSSIRRAYGRGYYDAIQKIENERLEGMNTARLDEAARSLSGVAKAVMEATPKTEPWTGQQICGELRRIGKNIETTVVMGCLGTLKRQGLVQEKPAGQFLRVTPKAKSPPPPALQVVQPKQPEPEAEAEPAPQPASEPPATDRGTLTKLADLSTKLRASADELQQFADAIDDVAIEVEERIQKINADSEKLAQLRALLKGIGA